MITRKHRHCFTPMFLVTCVAPFCGTPPATGAARAASRLRPVPQGDASGFLSKLWNADSRGSSGLPEMCGNRPASYEYSSGCIRAWIDRQRGWSVGLRDDHPCDSVPSAGALQQEAFHPLSRISVDLLRDCLVRSVGILGIIGHIPFFGWATFLIW